MGVKSFALELKVKVSASRLFKALVTDSHHVLPKINPTIKNIEFVEGHDVNPGCVLQTNFHEGGHFKFLKNRFEAIDPANHYGKFTLVEGDVLGDKVEKICYELKFEEAADGGCVIKLNNEYHGKGDHEVSEAELNAGKEHAVALSTRAVKSTCLPILTSAPEIHTYIHTYTSYMYNACLDAV